MAPALVHYGRVRDLTQSGASGQTEGSIESQQCISERHANGPCTSDRKLKENIVRVGDHPMGFDLYRLRSTIQYFDQLLSGSGS